jgi:hypothetical protein
MADVRLLTRRVTELENITRSSVSNPEVLASLVTVDVVDALTKRVADLEASLAVYKKFLEEALEKLGLMEQKVIGLEAKVCQCANGSIGSDCGADAVVQITTCESEAPVDTTTVTVTENPVYLEDSDDDAEVPVPAPAPAAAAAEEDIVLGLYPDEA